MTHTDTTDPARVVLVTGGSSGIGFATAQLLRQEGCAVSIVGRDPQRLADAAAQLGDVYVVQADLGQQHDAARAVAETVATFGRLDVLINAHGVLGDPAPLQELTP